MLFLLQITWYGHGTRANISDQPMSYSAHKCYGSYNNMVCLVTHAYTSVWPPLPKLSDQKFTLGHVGDTGVNKVIFTKNAISPSDYMVWSRDSCIYISLTPSTKVIRLKIHPGSLGVTGVKKVIFTKNAISHSDYMVWSRDSCIYISLTPLCKSYRIKTSPGVTCGHRGQKFNFTKNSISPSEYMVWSWDSYILIS